MAALPHSASITAESKPLRTHKHNHCKTVIKNVSESQGVIQSFCNCHPCAEQLRGREYKYIYIYLWHIMCQKAERKILSSTKQQWHPVVLQVQPRKGKPSLGQAACALAPERRLAGRKQLQTLTAWGRTSVMDEPAKEKRGKKEGVFFRVWN